MADTQDDPADELAWDLRALSAADGLRRASRARPEHAGSALAVRAFYPSLHLNLAADYVKLHRPEAARSHLRAGPGRAGALGDDGYGDERPSAPGPGERRLERTPAVRRRPGRRAGGEDRAGRAAPRQPALGALPGEAPQRAVHVLADGRLRGCPCPSRRTSGRGRTRRSSSAVPGRDASGELDARISRGAGDSGGGRVPLGSARRGSGAGAAARCGRGRRGRGGRWRASARGPRRRGRARCGLAVAGRSVPAPPGRAPARSAVSAGAVRAGLGRLGRRRGTRRDASGCCDRHTAGEGRDGHGDQERCGGRRSMHPRNSAVSGPVSGTRGQAEDAPHG